MAHIILMEDSPPLRRLLSRHLRDAGHTVAAYGEGMPSRDGTALSGANLLITDLSMPGADGWTVLENARHLDPALPVIVMTGESDDADRRLEKAVACLRKPFDEEALLSLVERTLDRTAPCRDEKESWNESRIATGRRPACIASLPSLRPTSASGRRP